MPILPILAATAPILGAGLNFVGQAIANRSNRRQARDAQNFELAQQNAQNVYNSPKGQISRYIEAGLNPRLMYGSGGSASAGNQLSKPQPHVADVKSVTSGIELPFLQMMTQYQDYKNKLETEGLIKNQNELTFQKTLTEGIHQTLMKEGKTKLEIENKWKPKLLESSFDLQQENIKKVNKENAQLLWKLQRENPEALKKLKNDAERAQIETDFLREMRVLGLGPNDPAYFRIGKKLFDKIFKNSDGDELLNPLEFRR